MIRQMMMNKLRKLYVVVISIKVQKMKQGVEF